MGGERTCKMPRDNNKATRLLDDEEAAPPRGGDTVAAVQAQVDQVQSVMRQNVDQMVSNMQATSNLEERSTALASQAATFHRSARSTRRHMWWMMCKQRMFVGGILLVILVAIILWICGAAGAFDGDGDQSR